MVVSPGIKVAVDQKMVSGDQCDGSCAAALSHRRG